MRSFFIATSLSAGIKALRTSLYLSGVELPAFRFIKHRHSEQGAELIRKLINSPRDYAWGSIDLISDYFGIEATGKPMAEIWYGTHPGSLTRVAPAVDEAGQTQPVTTLLHLRDDAPLSFLLKILAAGRPLSIQAHPTSKQAVAGFERENSLGIPIDSALRNYKDARHKPEMLVALTEFRALAGFETIEQLQKLFELLSANANDSLRTEIAKWQQLLKQGIKPLFEHLIVARESFDSLIKDLVAACEQAAATDSEFEPKLKLASELQELYPGDVGIAIALLMNHVVLQPGQAVQVSAGHIHAYLSGLGIEIMAASDNVLRGGLTSKHIDVDQLKKILNFEGKPATVVEGKRLSRGLTHYEQAVDDYLLYRVEVSGENLLADLELADPSIVLCTEGELAVSDSLGEREVLRKGEAAYLEGARLVTFAGNGSGFIATS